MLITKMYCIGKKNISIYIEKKVLTKRIKCVILSKSPQGSRSTAGDEVASEPETERETVLEN